MKYFESLIFWRYFQMKYISFRNLSKENNFYVLSNFFF